MKNKLFIVATLIVATLVPLLLIAWQSIEREVSSQEDENTEIPLENSSMGIDGADTQLIAKLENPYYLKGGQEDEFYLLVSVIGEEAEANSEKLPLNISMVIDRSGSMSSENKLGFVKDACKLVIDNLNNDDQLSIVAYDDWVRVIQPSGKINNKGKLKSSVNKLQPGGSTNLSGGMEAGYKEVKSTYQAEMVNRVLLLSDGLANEGITNVRSLQNIARNHYNQEHISISTFGVGADFNENLMTNIAEDGKGNYYFIDSSDKMAEIFKEELSGLLSVVAQKAKVNVSFPDDYLEIQEVFGFNSTNANGGLLVDYNEIFSKEEKTILIKFKAKKAIDQVLNLDIVFDYEDVNDNNQSKQLKKRVSITPTENKGLYSESVDMDVSRNKLLFIANQQFEYASSQVDQGRYDEARDLLIKNNAYLEKEFEKVKPDSALLKQFQANKEYEQKIENFEELPVYDQKMLQKNSKNLNYKIRKKKVK